VADYRIAVLDVGKTNKKLFVYDSDLNCLNPAEKGAVMPQLEIDGVLCDDMRAIYDWILAGLSAAVREYGDIRAISVSGHGATIALLGAAGDNLFEGDGGLVFPIVSYEQPISEAEEREFYEAVGAAPEELQRLTGTARFGWLLNHAKQIFWLSKRFPERFAQVTGVLMWPQYLSYLLTGEKGAEPTYLGCHGYLLDMNGADYSVVADALGVTEKLPAPPFRRSWEVLGTLKEDIAGRTGLSPSTLVTMGVHDSNAALVPYFVRGFENFVVQDSGTWVVTMSPRREATFAADEPGREVFFNRSIYGDPVKTTIFRGGAEFDFYAREVLRGRPHPAAVDEAVLENVLRRKEAFALPTVERGSGLFPESVARLEGLDTVFRDDAHAWCVVDLGLAVQGYRAIQMAAGGDVENIFIEGNIGRQNPLYRGVIASLFPEARVSYGSMGGAPYGAAILAAAAVEGARPEDLAERCRVSLAGVERPRVDGELVKGYAGAFLDRLGS
jgi:sugar (pentulose or hexulose) kinase